MKATASLYELQAQLYREGIQTVCGIDEAGRGPLVGPVVAGAVILPKDLVLEGLNDSKKLSERQREALYDEITAKAIGWGVGAASAQEIDQLNILQATFLAMARAVDSLPVRPDLLLVDGNRDPCLGFPTRTIVQGDEKVACISAASILAKVTRDREMKALGEKYPAYYFERHKGYPTKLHYEQIEKLGLIAEYRRSFFKKRPWLLREASTEL